MHLVWRGYRSSSTYRCYAISCRLDHLDANFFEYRLILALRPPVCGKSSANWGEGNEKPNNSFWKDIQTVIPSV